MRTQRGATESRSEQIGTGGNGPLGTGTGVEG